MARARGDSRGISEVVLDEVVDDAIRVVAMMRKPILSEEHLIGAFWATSRILLRQHREGRHRVRVGSRSRLALDEVSESLVAEDPVVEEVLEAKDRAVRAADYVAQLSELERNVVAVMAVDGAGIKATSRSLGLPVKDVKAAERSARAKLDRIAVIAAAGRMCDYRQPTIAVYASGRATPQQERVARAHLASCSSCRSEYRKLVREMRTGRFQRAAASAFLPASLLSTGRSGLLSRLTNWVPAGPRVGVERLTEALGGAGAVKIAAAGSALVVATATVAGVHPQSLIESQPIHHHSSRLTHQRHRSPQASPTTQSAYGQGASSAGEVPTDTHPHRALTPQRRAELEFGSIPPSTGGGTVRTRSAARSAGTSRTEVAPSSERHTTTATGGEALRADREFGLP